MRNISEAMIESGYYPEATAGDISDESDLYDIKEGKDGNLH